MRHTHYLRPLTADPPGELDILQHVGDSLGVDCAEVGVLEQSHLVGLTGFLESSNSGRLEPEVGLEVLSYLPDLKG